MNTQTALYQYPHNHLISLLDGFVDFSAAEKYDLSFKGLSLNSKKVHEGFLFFACAGSDKSKQHGIAYAGEAINSGACCILWEPTSELKTMPLTCHNGERYVPLIRVEDLHKKAGEIAARFYQHPGHRLTVTGITGTNGKTSTIHFIAQILSFINNTACALIGTLGNGLYGQLQDSSHTTPDAITMQSLMADFVKQQVKILAMEVSSHALSQGRVNGVEFDTAVFTNLSRDHLDYHGDMQTYAKEKLKLFQMASVKNCVVNLDDAFSQSIIDNTKKIIASYSKKDSKADYYADNIMFNSSGLAFTLHLEGRNFGVNTQLIGDFNIDNLLAAIAVLHCQGYNIIDIITAVEKITTVSGRMEKVNEWPLVVIDYAHTPDALDKSLSALKSHTKGKLYCIFGCGGDRDRGKRPLMAKVAENIADQIIVTADNSRNESVHDIIDDIVSGFENAVSDQNNVSIEPDRKTAIVNVLAQLMTDDTVLIAGKGHEVYQEINDQRIPFSDKAVVADFYNSGKQGL